MRKIAISLCILFFSSALNAQSDRLRQELDFITPEAPANDWGEMKEEVEDEISLSQSAPRRGQEPEQKPKDTPPQEEFKLLRHRSR